MNSIERYAAAINANLKDNECKSSFDSATVPDVSLVQFMERIEEYAPMSEAGFVMAIVYIDRTCKYLGINASQINIHRLLITAYMLANKVLSS